MMKKIIKLALFLGIVAALSGLILGYVNSLTEPIIEDRSIAAEKESLELMYPGANFKLAEYNDDSGIILGAYEVKGIGYIFKATGTGYNSSTPIICLIGITNDGKVDNVIALQSQETNGFGSKCFEEANIKKLYIGKTSGEDVDMLAGASFTSNAMKKMITKAFETFKEVK